MSERSRRNDAGFSLIEVLVTVVIVGITFVVFVGGMGTSFMASDYHRKQAVAHASIRNFAEAVKATPFSTDCANVKARYEAAFSPPPPARRSAAGLATNATSHAAPSVTPLSTNTRLLAFYSLAGGPTLTVPTGMAKLWAFSSNASTAANRVTAGFAEQSIAAKTPTGVRTATSSSAATSISHLISIPRAAAGDLVRRGASWVGSSDAGAATLTLSAPTGTVKGDALFAQVAVRGATSVAPPPGWTVVSATANGSSVRSLIYEKTAATATEQFVWTFSSVTQAAAGIVSYGGASRSYTTEVTAVKFWDGINAPSATCPAPEANFLQIVSLKIGSTDARALETIDVIKRCHNRPTSTSVCADS